MSKSPEAFRTISEVADWLDTPAHVLRFWESKFSQVKPVKRAGGRRYYRPADMELIGGIKKLLHDDGMTIKGVQKMLREHGVRHVSSLSQPIDVTSESEDGELIDAAPFEEMAEPQDTVVPFGAPAGANPDPPERRAEAPVPESEPGPAPEEAAAGPVEAPGRPNEAAPDPEPRSAALAAPVHRPQLPPKAGSVEERPADAPAEPAPDATTDDVAGADSEDLPDFLTSPTFPGQAATPAPRRQSPPPVPADDEIEAAPGALSHLARLRRLSPEEAARIRLVAERLRALNARLTGR